MSSDAAALPSGLGWRFLHDSASVVVVRVNDAGTILAVNRHAATLIGEPLVGQPWHAMLLNFAGRVELADWLADTARPRLLNVRTTAGLPQTLEVTVEAEGRDHLLIGEVNAADQARLGREVLELNHELNQATRELALKNAELDRLDALKNQFLGMAAHDLRKPAGLILSYAELLIDDAASSWSAEQREFLQVIRTAADRMRGVIDDFLDVSLIEAGRLSLDVQKADLADLVQAARTLVAASAAKRKIHIAAELDPEGRVLLVDGPKIEQVLTNLLSNAVEHTPAEGCVRIGSRRTESEVRVWVADNGKGIAPQQRARLFQAFAGDTAPKAGGERSIGLGLAIARKIVEAHGGRMFVESEPGRGALFGFTLPANGGL
jgi:signal transduction histidine kinase